MVSPNASTVVASSAGDALGFGFGELQPELEPACLDQASERRQVGGLAVPLQAVSSIRGRDDADTYRGDRLEGIGRAQAGSSIEQKEISMGSPRALAAELFGTFWLVLGGCGTAVLAGSVMGTLGISIAFGLTVLTGAYALGHISGGHFNPAVTIGLIVGRRFESKDAIGYIVAQLVGAVLAAVVILVVANGVDGFSASESGFAANGFDDQSPGGYNLLAALVIEVVLTAVFLVVILGVTADDASPGFAGLAIGLALTLIHLISIPVTNTSVNPARSTSQAIFAGSDYLSQLWLFWVAPIAGAVLGAVVYVYVLAQRPEPAAAA